MKRILPLFFAVLFLGILAWTVSSVVSRRMNEQTATFFKEAHLLIDALQKYRNFVGHFPAGTHVEIANALSGQNDSSKKVLLIADSMRNRNNQGEMVDPWGTPLQIFFTHNAILIRSAGPNRTFEDFGVPEADDLFYSDAK